ncbi:MAG TPA: hypothetical protein VH816_09420 [Gaiellaceae bacterium]|jgi:hypothetical protein
MIDPQHMDLAGRFDDLVDDPIRPATSGSQSFELALQCVADSVRVLGRRTEHELDDRGRGLFGQTRERALD